MIKEDITPEERRFMERYPEGKRKLDKVLSDWSKSETEFRKLAESVSEEYGIPFRWEYGGYVPETAISEMISHEPYEDYMDWGRDYSDSPKWNIPQELKDFLAGKHFPGCDDGYSHASEPGWWMPSRVC